MTWLLILRLYGRAPIGDLFGSPTAILLVYIGAGAPTLIAILLSYITDGREGLSTLRKRLFRIRIGLFPWMLAIALPCACAISATACYALFADDLGRLEPPPWQAIVPPSAFVLFFAGPLCEETGWRGYLQPHLLKVFAPFRAALIIGVIWCFWHIPLSLTPGTMPVLDSPTTWFQYLVSTIAVSIIIMLIVLRGHGSIAVAMLFHWASNAALSQVVAPMYPAASDQACDNVELIQTGLLLIVASTIMLRSGDIFNQHSVSN